MFQSSYHCSFLAKIYGLGGNLLLEVRSYKHMSVSVFLNGELSERVSVFLDFIILIHLFHLILK